MYKEKPGKAFQQVGLPLLLLVVGGTWGLSRLLQGKYTVKVQCRIALMFTVLKIGPTALLPSSAGESKQEAQQKALVISQSQKAPKRTLKEELQVSEAKHSSYTLSLVDPHCIE